MREDKVTIKIPRALYKKLQKIVKTSGFSSVTELIVFTMRLVVSDEKIDIKNVKNKLKKLGYI